jgi:hypothetical protein
MSFTSSKLKAPDKVPVCHVEVLRDIWHRSENQAGSLDYPLGQFSVPQDDRRNSDLLLGARSSWDQNFCPTDCRPQGTGPARNRAFLTADVLVGIFLLAAMATALIVAAHVQAKSASSFADQRKANAIAQEVMLNLQTTGAATTSDQAAKVSVDRTGKRVGDQEWVEVRVQFNTRHASIVGLSRSGGAQ